MLDQFCQKSCVSVIGERITSGFNALAGVEVAVGDMVVDLIVVGHGQTQRFNGTVEAADIEVFCLLSWSFDSQHSEYAYLRKDINETGVHVASNTRVFSVLLPIVVGGSLEKIIPELVEIVA